MTQHAVFACPACKRRLTSSGVELRCVRCNRLYAVEDGIPNLTLEHADISNGRQSTLMARAYAKFFDLIAPIYESRAWYQLTLNLSGARGNSIRTIAAFVAEALTGVDGAILDVACGTATYSRRIADPHRIIYGIDLSYGMLRKGRAYLAAEDTRNVVLARASAMDLPFESEMFDAAICAGSLHLFPEAATALAEIARTLKDGAPLALQTFLPAKKRRNPSVKERTGFRLFLPDELQKLLSVAGFEQIALQIHGTVLTARCRRTARGVSVRQAPG